MQEYLLLGKVDSRAYILPNVSNIFILVILQLWKKGAKQLLHKPISVFHLIIFKFAGKL